MIDSETGLPYDWSNPGGGSASTQPALIPNGQPTPVGQGVGQGGGMSPLLMQLFGGGGGGMSPLLMALMGGAGGVPSTGANGQILPQIAQYLMGQQQQQPQGPPPDPLTAQQRAFMGYGGQGQPPNWAAAMGMDDPTGGWTPGYQPQSPQQASTPQGFLSQWNQLFGGIV